MKGSTPTKQALKKRATCIRKPVGKKLVVKGTDNCPGVPAFDALCQSQEPLTPEVKEKIEAHLKVCRRCRNVATSAEAYVGYFRRLMKAPIDC